MQFTTLTLVLAGAAGLMASPVVERATTKPTADLTPNSYVEHYRTPAKTSNGTLIFLGPPLGNTQNARSEPNTIEERASCSGSTAPVCSTSHTARNDICDQLVTELQGDATVTVGASPRQICYEGSAAGSDDNAYCCVSWHNVVSGLNKGDLWTPANSILTTCTANGISGKINNLKIESTCTSVCLSNRGTGC